MSNLSRKTKKNSNAEICAQSGNVSTSECFPPRNNFPKWLNFLGTFLSYCSKRSMPLLLHFKKKLNWQSFHPWPIKSSSNFKLILFFFATLLSKFSKAFINVQYVTENRLNLKEFGSNIPPTPWTIIFNYLTRLLNNFLKQLCKCGASELVIKRTAPLP